MPTRSKGSSKQAADPLEAVKPLIVLGLLGMILYGAFTVIRRGPAGAGGPSVPGLEPPTVNVSSDSQPFRATPAPQASLPSVPAESAVAGGPPSDGSGDPASPPPLVLKAVSSAPPVVDAGEAVPSAPATAPPLVIAAPPAATAALNAPPAVPAAAFTPPPSVAPAAPERQPGAFAAAWADAHEKLAAARYAEALAVLSAWYDDPSLGPEETQRLEELLGQLAGTVIYSREDHLLPPHIVAPGENLRDIAAGLNVPWQVLGKINGVDGPAKIMPGEPLKVVAGPFDAVVSLSRRRLSLQLKGNYAGSFTVVIGRQVEEHVGTALSVQRVRRGGRPPADAPVSATAVTQAAHEQSQPAAKQILIAGGLVIEAADDPSAVAESAAGKSLIVSSRDLDELIDILGDGSRIFVRP